MDSKEILKNSMDIRRCNLLKLKRSRKYKLRPNSDMCEISNIYTRMNDHKKIYMKRGGDLLLRSIFMDMMDFDVLYERLC